MKFIILAFLIIINVNPDCVYSQIRIIKNIDHIIFANSGIQLHINNNMYAEIFYEKNEKLFSLNNYKETLPQNVPLYFPVISNTAFKNFELNSKEIKSKKIQTYFGSGERLTISGSAEISETIILEQILTFELYDDFPNTVIAYAQYINNSKTQSITIDTLYNTALTLDASIIDSSKSSHEFYSFYGTDGRPSRQKEKILPKNFDINVYTGRPESLEGIKEGNGGIPIIDIWCKEMGIGIGHVETEWKDLFFPARVQTDGRVFIAIKEIPNINKLSPPVLKPGESYQTIKSFINVHSLDFYATAETYSSLMKRQGIDFRTKSSENDYMASWCSWNEYSTKAMASKKDVMVIKLVLDRLDDLKKMNIGEVVFDAGWFNNQGDWRPNEDSLSFPDGDSDIINAINLIHKKGLTVRLWISLLTADPWSEVSSEHLDWMIKKTNGEFHLDRWSGYTMCPTVPEVATYYKLLAQRLVGVYKADGFKIDGMYVCPPCYNPSHGHKNPNESSATYQKVFESFYKEAISINPKTSINVCPCGSVCSFTILPFMNQSIAADPKTFETVRRRMKLYRALKGPNTPYSSDYIDIIKGNLKFPEMFANAVGIGAVPQTFYGKSLTPDTLEIYQKWFKIYSDEKVSQAEYLNLYDMHFDKPDTYVFYKSLYSKGVFYFSFFADNDSWNGKVEFRGLQQEKNYDVNDYVSDKNLGTISGRKPIMNVSFENYLLLKVSEK